MFWERCKYAFRETPFTMGVISLVLLVWLLNFFGASQPMMLLGGEVDLQHPWRVLTYPLATPSVAIWLVLGLYCFSLFARPIERIQGTVGMARLFLLLTALFAGVQWVAVAAALRAVPASVNLWGLENPALGIFFIWASLHREATILLMFVIPVPAKYLALLVLFLTFLSPAGPLYGLAAALICAGCWKWAEGLNPYRRPGSSTGQPNRITRWWKERQRARRMNRLQLLEGGAAGAGSAAPSNLPNLKSASPVKDDAAGETELDRILDKIRFEGMSSLTEQERATLDGQSRKLRGDR